LWGILGYFDAHSFCCIFPIFAPTVLETTLPAETIDSPAGFQQSVLLVHISDVDILACWPAVFKACKCCCAVFCMLGGAG
jgi:hypothetical protein